MDFYHELSFDNVECILSNFNEDFYFTDFEDACSYDGDSDRSSKEVDDNNFIFPTDVEQAFLNSELLEVLPTLNTHNPIELINTPYGVKSMANLLDKDRDEDYSIANTDDDDDRNDDDNESNGLISALQYRTYSDDSSSDHNNIATGSIPTLINHFDSINNDDNSNNDNFFDISDRSKEKRQRSMKKANSSNNVSQKHRNLF